MGMNYKKKKRAEKWDGGEIKGRQSSGVIHGPGVQYVSALLEDCTHIHNRKLIAFLVFVHLQQQQLGGGAVVVPYIFSFRPSNSLKGL
jgi:hypothetical protein